MVARPRTVVFDVIGTLMSLSPLCARFSDVGVPADALGRWVDRLQRDGMALALTGDFAPFSDVAAAALRFVAPHDLDDDAISHVLDGFRELPAHPDVAPAFAMLKRAGIPMASLSNGTTENTRAFLGHNGLADSVDRVFSISEVRRWKPARHCYDHAAREIGLPADQLALVAVHAFDCHGAKAAGWMTGWANRSEGSYAKVFTAPDVIGADLVEVVSQLLA